MELPAEQRDAEGSAYEAGQNDLGESVDNGEYCGITF